MYKSSIVQTQRQGTDLHQFLIEELGRTTGCLGSWLGFNHFKSNKFAFIGKIYFLGSWVPKMNLNLPQNSSTLLRKEFRAHLHNYGQNKFLGKIFFKKLPIHNS